MRHKPEHHHRHNFVRLSCFTRPMYSTHPTQRNFSDLNILIILRKDYAEQSLSLHNFEIPRDN
jgi:hypothetical protein